jgi:ribonuclease HII
MRILGIDEAGRGCVLGSLFVGAFLDVTGDEALLRKAGAADSKKLSHKKREAAREKLSPLGLAEVVEVSATAIDAGNLNELEEIAVATLVAKHAPDLVLMDALGPPAGLPALVARLSSRVGKVAGPKWTIEPKADDTYAAVGAASIFAKTDRDRALSVLDAVHGPLGSGYPSDPVTRSWIATWQQSGRPWPNFVRTRWGTLEAVAQTRLFGA